MQSSDKRGQVFFYAFMLGLTIFVLALALAGPVREFIDDARSPSNLDCDNSAISNFDKAACIASDLTLFQFIGGLIFMAGTVITAKLVFT